MDAAGKGSVFCPPQLIARAKANVQRYPWAAQAQQGIVAAAQPWMGMSDEELWQLMFGHTMTRSWMVWSNGHCPACKQGVPMYQWQIDAFQRPWRVQCPHCKELFPKNDFHRFYRSGLDERGVFDPKKADRTLLFNAEHPEAGDLLRGFGVDDGEGYVEGDKRWRFIGAYLIYGQWKQMVLAGIHDLAAAYAVTGERPYAHKAGVLLDRVADLYTSFDFEKQGLAYERGHGSGYVSTWHDACEETRALVLAYDEVRDALRTDTELAAFLSRKAQQVKMDRPKATPQDVQRNIEEGILRDALVHQERIHSNYPRTDVAIATIKTVLGWPENREEVYAILDPMVEKATAVDGVTGEKGLTGYTAFTIQGLAVLLAQYARLDPDFLKDALRRHPGLCDAYRFHIDTRCLDRYYPQSGDTGAFAQSAAGYAGVPFSQNAGLDPSMYSFLWQLYQATGDEAYVQVLYGANGGSVAGLPYDLFAEDPEGLRKDLQAVIARAGASPRLGSVNKQGWHLGILRSGEGRHARALWLDYDAGGGHGHLDGMNLGLFARGLDLLPEFGYPPVQYGGWGSPRANWYVMTAGHNTVVVDGQSQRPAAGKTTLWADGRALCVLRASGPELYGLQQYERTAALIDVSGEACYVLDVFRIVGGTDHAWFLHSGYGTLATQGLTLQPAGEYGHGTFMRAFRTDADPQPGWSADWKIEDRYGMGPKGAEVHLRYHALTPGAPASTAEAWVSAGGTAEAWIPRLMMRRQAQQAPLSSTFAGILEPYEGAPKVARVRRLPLVTPGGAAYPDTSVAMEVELADGRRDLLIAADTENPLGLAPSRKEQRVLVQPGWGVRLDGDLCWIRRDASGRVQSLALCGGRAVSAGEVAVEAEQETEFVEVTVANGRASVVAGGPGDAVSVRRRRQ